MFRFASRSVGIVAADKVFFRLDSFLFVIVMIRLDSPALAVDSVFEESPSLFWYIARLGLFCSCVEGLCSVLDGLHSWCSSRLGCSCRCITLSRPIDAICIC